MRLAGLLGPEISSTETRKKGNVSRLLYRDPKQKRYVLLAAWRRRARASSMTALSSLLATSGLGRTVNKLRKILASESVSQQTPETGACRAA